MKINNNIFAFLEKNGFFSTIDESLKQTGRHLFTGVQGSISTLILSRDVFLHDDQTFVLVPTMDEANSLMDELSNFVNNDEIYVFPAEEVLFSQDLTSSPENQRARTLFMQALVLGQKGVFFLTPESLIRTITGPTDFKAAGFSLNFNSKISLEELVEKLNQAGLKRVAQVEKIGEYAVRGDIIDFYTFGEDHPIRLELFDTEVDSIRAFDLDTQRSLDQITNAQVTPVTDRIIKQKDIDNFLNSKESSELKNYLKEYLNSEHPLFNFPYLEKIIGNQTILNYLPKSATFFIFEYAHILDLLGGIDDQLVQLKDNLNQENHYFKSDFCERSVVDLIRGLKNRQVFLANIKRGIGRISFKSVHNIISRAAPNFVDRLPAFEMFLDESTAQNRTLILSLPEKSQRETLKKIAADLDLTVVEDNIVAHKINLVNDSFSRGFDLIDENITLISQNDLFTTKKKRRRRSNFLDKNSRKITNFSELKVGDYLVHIHHGIGRFVGMTTETRGGVSRDYITIQFAGSGKLYVPINQIQFIQKYQSDNGIAPKLNKLGSAEWRKTQQKVANKIDDMADELIERYADRQAKKGFAFSPRSSYEVEFAEAFPYVETPDQSRSIEEVLSDMEKSIPMDRLLVGDVGFGKTEVAMRAAFKAVLDHKQVAVLAPTTILVDQHYNSFIDRFRNFPVSIEMISRFRTTKEIKEVIKKVKAGQVDIVIGTHRLLSKDVSFSDLGLLIVDEEQRFGVRHKERLKELKSNVDVLTLTATPIPRTLQLATLGIMDLSLIETPPPDRYPVMTYVSEFSIDLIKDAIRRELQRNGQVFYLHNRVSDIEGTVSFLKGLFSDAEVGFVDGQMTETQLENTMLDFMEGRFDILVTTTIIEIGVDIANANTMIIENADHFGLSTLYQLRGRIGRSNRMAYAYLTYRADRSISETSEKRLSAIRDFTELGSGYKLAMTDLSIRGAGNILGKEQHGFINAVGFDLFLAMLTDAVQQKMGRVNRYQTKSVVELDWSNYISDEYITDRSEKIEMYQRILHAKTDQEVDELLDEMIDRFGEPPVSVLNLLNTARIKIQADMAGITKITSIRDQIRIIFSSVMTKVVDQKVLAKIIFEAKWKIKLSLDDQRYNILIENSNDQITSAEFLGFITKIRELVVEKESET
ncbi:transcription-repair coupling factor [Xylocopilactobacillus apicola]|uniref:Transcription-repair-coupling factor n=1 Tax=Xylocopilactobacillus apicola TaxID=2932184 RepID=A0AAU9DMU8_9LACO|nr:transcription-repair coupling factor [Xylocopilactobacillus apicola]BDR58332.1 transcription-repair-coupling factor [Xylocopilactobacillus apicola]